MYNKKAINLNMLRQDHSNMDYPYFRTYRASQNDTEYLNGNDCSILLHYKSGRFTNSVLFNAPSLKGSRLVGLTDL